MRLVIHAVGRMKSGPETELLARYVERAGKAGRQMGFRSVSVHEYPEARLADAELRKQAEAQVLLAGAAPGTFRIALDENGEELTSAGFAGLLQRNLDNGLPETAFMIGGPDGHGSQLLGACERKIRLGSMTWPHQLVRILMAEQVYRAITILSGHPYHRE